MEHFTFDPVGMTCRLEDVQAGDAAQNLYLNLNYLSFQLTSFVSFQGFCENQKCIKEAAVMKKIDEKEEGCRNW